MSRICFPAALSGTKGKRQTREVTSPATAANHDVREGPGELHLGDGLLADDGLVQQDVIEDAAQRVIGVLALRGILYCLADGDAQAAGAVGIFGKNLSSGSSLVAR